MSDKEFMVHSAKDSLRFSESRVRETREDLKREMERRAAMAAVASAETARELYRLNEMIRRAESELERAKAYVAKAESDLEKGFDE